MLSKKEYSYKFINNNDIFICPYCHEKLVLNNNAFVCENNHTFDIGKKGEVFLVKTSSYKQSKIYNKELFMNRRKFIENDFYKPIYNEIANIVNQLDLSAINIFDLGCGEGLHSTNIQKCLKQPSNIIGLDYSKDAILMATDYLDRGNFYLVGDINNIPIKDKSMDIILDFLSPYNSNEVKRIIKESGYFIKVAPCKNYLKEIKNKEYENEKDVRQNLESNFKIIKEINIVKKYNLDKASLVNLINMTPMDNNKLNDKINEITIDNDKLKQYGFNLSLSIVHLLNISFSIFIIFSLILKDNLLILV